MKPTENIVYRKPLLLFLLFTVVAYLPVFLPFFHLKNDLITQNLPTRYFISESLYSGYFPWWNPYIHFGIPQYGDMNNGFWNPIMWLIAKTAGYNIRTITFEEMLYIFIGGWGFYKLTKELGINKGIAILAALCYICCGYITGHLQHFCWIRGTAFFPFVFLFFLRVNKYPILKNFLAGALSVFLFVSSTHPGLVIGALYFFVFAIAIIYIFRKNYTRAFYQNRFFLINFTFLLLSSVFSIAVIISNVDVLQHISRGQKVSLAEALMQPTSFSSYLSLLFPLSVNKSAFFATDISMRNAYIGLPVLAGFVILFRYINKKIIIALIVPLLFFILLSSGGFFKTLFYHTLPLIGYVRLNGEFTYFAMLILLLAGAFGLQFLLTDKNLKKTVKRIGFIFMTACFISIVMAISILLIKHSSIFFSIAKDGNFKFFIKKVIDNSEFVDLLLLNAAIQLITILFITRNYSHKKLFLATAVNLILITWLTLPFTGLGMASKSEMNNKMVVLPHGIYPQKLVSLNKTKFIDSAFKKELWLLGSYSKKIGYPGEEYYPVQLNSSEKFYQDSSLQQFINQQAFIFLSTDTTINAKTIFDSSIIQINKFGPGSLKITLHNQEFNYVTLLQNDYPYWETFVNGKKIDHFTGFKTFITIPVQKGTQTVEFYFDPRPVKKALWVNMEIIFAGLILLSIRRFRNIRLIS